MKTGEAAKILGVDRTTIINWIESRGLERFFSPGAKGEDGGTQRTLTESDVLILNTIRAKRSESMDWREIAGYLETGSREQEFPQNAIAADTRTVPVQQAEMSAKALATVAERDQALARVKELSAYVEELNLRLEAERERANQLLREIAELQREVGDRDRLEKDLQATTTYNRELLDELKALQRQIGRLEGQMEFYRQNSSEQGDGT